MRSASELPPSMKLKAACTQCPFRLDKDFISKERKLELTYQLGALGSSFTCHKTLDYSHDCDDEGDARFVSSQSNHCAGAMHYLNHIGHPNTVMQIGERLGMWSMADLKGAELVHSSIAGFVGDEAFPDIDSVVRHVEKRP